MSIHSKKWITLLLTTPVVLFIVMIFIIVSPQDSYSQEIQIVSPADGAIFSPGDEITVIIEPGLGTFFVQTAVMFRGRLAPEGLDELSPFEILVTLPNTIGTTVIQAFARDQANKVFSTEVTVNLVTQASLQQIKTESRELDFTFFLENDSLFVTGIFDDGTKFNITSPSLGTTYRTLSGTSAVVEVSPDGLVKALGNGQDIIIVENNGITVTVPVTVKATNTPPDIVPIADQTLEAGTTLDIPITATDPEGDVLKLDGADLPSFATVLDNGDRTGTLHLAPTANDVGSHNMMVTVLDNGNPSLGGGEELEIIVTAPSVAVAEGDFNADGCIDRADYGILIADIRNRAPNNPAYDLNGDGVVNRADGRTLFGLFTNPRGASCQ